MTVSQWYQSIVTSIATVSQSNIPDYTNSPTFTCFSNFVPIPWPLQNSPTFPGFQKTGNRATSSLASSYLHRPPGGVAPSRCLCDASNRSWKHHRELTWLDCWQQWRPRRCDLGRSVCRSRGWWMREDQTASPRLSPPSAALSCSSCIVHLQQRWRNANILNTLLRHHSKLTVLLH